jgi:hypothetical protein
MTTRERIKFEVGEVARFVATYSDLADPDDVKREHVDLAYEILWLTLDKLEVELNTDCFEVERAICSAIEEYNLSFSYEDDYYRQPMEEEAA